MTAREMGMSIGLNIAATSVGWYIKGPIGAIIVGCTGIAITAITHFLTRKPAAPLETPAPPVTQDVKQENKQEFNPQFNPQFTPTFSPQQNVYIGAHPHAHDINAIRDDARREAMIIEYLKKSPPNTGYDVAELSEAVGLTMPEVRDLMENLEARKIVWSVEQLNVVGGKAYLLDELHRPQPAPRGASKPNTVTTYTSTGNELTADDPQMLLQYRWRDTRNYQTDSLNMPLTIWNAGKETAVNFQIAEIRNGSWKATFPLVPHLAAGERADILASVDYEGLRHPPLAHSLVSMVKPAGQDEAKRESHSMRVKATYANPRGQKFSGEYEFQWKHEAGECTAILVALSRQF